MTEQRLPSYGGQALIEGVLMRGANHVVASMRAPDGISKLCMKSWEESIKAGFEISRD